MRFDLDGNVLDRFVTFVAIDRALPPLVGRLTGLRDEDLAGAPTLTEAIGRLAHFAGDATLVGHNVGFDLAFLGEAGFRPLVPALDTAELASCVLPTAGSYALPRLAADVGHAPVRSHRALEDAETAAALCTALVDRAAGLCVDTLEGAAQLAPLVGPALALVFDEALRRRARTAFIDPPRVAAARTGHPAAGERVRRGDELGASAAELLAPSGALAAAFERFESRAEQVTMADAVDGVFAEGGVLVVEAGTGTGKSLAYLVPALRAAARGRRVLISTYTTNLQEQLAGRDLPRLIQALGLDFSIAVLKGRQNYLCPRRWQLLRTTAQSAEEARFALRTLVWRETTETGDRGELNVGGDERDLWTRVCAEDEACTTRRCAAVRGGCYLERARQAAERADVVIANHALLLADARSRNRLLPDRPILVVDEAHHLEEVAARAFGVRLEAAEVRRALQRTAHGALAQHAAAGAAAEVLALRAEGERAMGAADETFAALARVMPPPEARGFEDRARVTDVTRGGPEWLAVELAAERLRDGLGGTAAAAERLLALGADEDVAAETESAVRGLREADGAIARAVHAYRPAEICWLAQEQGSELPVLQTEPAHAGSYIARLVVSPRDATVLTSATLSVGGSLEFAVDRFGLSDRAATLRLGSPFELRQQALLVLPQNLLDPYERGFIGQVAETVAAIGRALGGRTLVLFTAHTMLREVRARFGGAADDVVPLAQGVDGSRRQLLEQFAAGGAVLLGTAAFWEGIDLPGDLLRCVVVAKLPFPVPDDPVVAGRAERYDDPFLGYHLPIAALRLQQGFGRLIRTREDRGAVVVLDRRISTRAYGEVLIASLPPCAIARPELDDVAGTVEAWCASRQLDPRRSGEPA